MKTVQISLNSIDKVKSFVNAITQYEYDFDLSDEQVLLNEDGFKKFCLEYEKWMMRTGTLSERNFRQIIKKQVSILKKSIQNQTDYIPFSWEEEYGVRGKL